MAQEDNVTSTAIPPNATFSSTISTPFYTTSGTSTSSLNTSTSWTSAPEINSTTTGFSFSTVTTPDVNATNSTQTSGCLKILYEDIGSSRVRIWDVVLFVPNLLFLIFLLHRFYKSRGRVYRGLGGTTPIFTTYFVLVTMTAFLSVIRCIVSMTVDVTSVAGSDANKLLWVVLRFFLLMAEMSVLVFGLACGHLDSRSSIRRVLFTTTFFALVYSVTQGVLEMIQPDPAYEVPDESWTVYGHGGPLFSLITSIIFCANSPPFCLKNPVVVVLFGLVTYFPPSPVLYWVTKGERKNMSRGERIEQNSRDKVYIFVDLLPFCDCMKQYFTIPTKKMFYVYITTMAVLYFCFSLGSGLLYKEHSSGLCILDAAAVIYFIFFAPLLYWTFLHSYLSNIQQNSVLFSYSAQVDEGLDDTHESGAHSARPGADFNGVLVFDRLPSTTYDTEKTGMEEPLHDLAGEEKERHDSEAADGSTVNFFKDIDLADNDEELNFR